MIRMPKTYPSGYLLKGGQKQSRGRQKLLDPPTVTTPKPLEEPHEAGLEKGRKEPVVQLQRLPRELDKLAHQTLSRRSGLSTTATRTAAAATGSPEIEAMEIEAPPVRPSPPQPHRSGSRKSSKQSPRGGILEEVQGSSDDQQSQRTTPKQDRSTRRAAPPGPSPFRGSGAGLHDPHAPARAIAAAHLDTIRQGGGLRPPGPHLGAVPHEDWNIPKKGDWTREPFPPMEWKVPPPSGISLITLPPEQPDSWKPWAGISQSELLAYLERIARGTQRDANHEHYQRFARFRQDTMDALQRFKNNLQALQNRSRHLDPDLAGTVLVTVRDLQRREIAARQAAAEAGQNAVRVAAAHSELNQEHEKLKAELQQAQEQVAEAQRRVEAAEKRERKAVEATNPKAVSEVLKVTNQHLGSQEVERKRLVSELQSLCALYNATLPEDQVKDLIRARDAAREQVLQLTNELDAARGTVKELEGTNQRLVDECQQQLQAREGAPADPHAAERLRAAEQELQGLKALLEERGRYVALQSERLQDLEKTKEQQRKCIEELEEQLKRATPTSGGRSPQPQPLNPVPSTGHE